MNDLIKLSIYLSVLDGIFIYVIRKKFNNQIELVQHAPLKLDMFAGIMTYIILIFMVYYFIIKENKSIKDAFILGLCTYGVYEFTTKTLLKDWSYETVMLDTLWGGILFSLSTYLIKKY